MSREAVILGPLVDPVLVFGNVVFRLSFRHPMKGSKLSQSHAMHTSLGPGHGLKRIHGVEH